MKLRRSSVVSMCLVLGAIMLIPSVAVAQRRVGGGVGVRVGTPRRPVVVGGYYYRPVYRRAFYGSAFYRPFFYDAWSPYWYGQFPPYYGYGGYYDLSGSLRLQVTPRNTEVFIDGYYAGTVDDFDGVFQRLRVEPGDHDLELYLPGHRGLTQKIYLQPGRTFRIRHAMEPLAPGEAEPVRPAGTAPPPNQTLPSRPAPGPGPTARQPRDTAPRTSPSSTYGTLTLRVQPGEATVLIDGERWDGPEGDERLVLQLAAGRHVMEIQKDGYRTYTTEVTVRNGETTTLNVALTKQ